MSYPRLKCPKCDVEFGQEARLKLHLTNAHDITDFEQCYVDTFLSGVRQTCACSVSCQEKVKWSGWKRGYTSKYVRGHNAVVDSSFLDKEKQKAFVEKRIEGFQSGRNRTWNAGLTKETDERVRRQSESVSKTLKTSYQTGQLVDWKKNDPIKAQLAAKKQSETMKQKYASGEIVSWNLGRTKESDKRLAQIAENIKKALNEDVNTSSKRFKPEQLVKIISDVAGNVFDLQTPLSDYRNKYQKLKFVCKTCGSIQQKNITMLVNTPICFHCHPKESKGQLEVVEFVKSLGFHDVVSNDRVSIAPRELDVYVPSKNFAIEFNGLYWHSSCINTDNQHNQLKLDDCIKNGISLLTIFEDEWRDRRRVVEGMIQHRLGMSKTLFARDLTIVDVSTTEARQFFDDNHLEGYVPSTKVFGLKHNEHGLVACMSLRRPFHKRYATNYLEVARSAPKSGYNVIGWIGKLSKAALLFTTNEYKKMGMMTYVDSRVGLGRGYEMAGWKQDASSTGLRFWWTDFYDRFNRFKFKATENMTQDQVATSAGVVPIYGCTNSRWILNPFVV